MSRAQHGLSRGPDGQQRPEYFAWHAMTRRCGDENHPGYPDYGARGIQVCAEWADSFETFYRDMGDRPTPKHSLDRIDNDGNYEPGNCRWTTRVEQARNTQRTKLMTWNGVTQPAAAWADEAVKRGYDRRVVLHRLYMGWSVEDALTWPVGRRRRSHRHDGRPSVRQEAF